MLAFLPTLDALPTTSLMCPATGDCPGIYDNVLAEPGSPVFDSSPHVWTHTVPVDPCSFDAPYDAYAVDPSTSTSKLGFIGGSGIEGGQGNSDSIYGSHDDHSTYGVSGSGWQGPGNGEAPGDLWNPAVATNTGMAPSQQLSAPVALATANPESATATHSQTARASPGHVMLMGHALVFGALSATKEVMESGFAESWKERFAENSSAACQAVTPVGGYVLKKHVLNME